jgi:hypothetical protein
MKKYRIVVLVVLMNAVLGGQNLFAHKKKPELPDHYLTFSFVIHPVSVGYKHRVAGSTYLTTNLDYVGDKDDIYFQVGAAYMIPRKIWIFWFYGGTGPINIHTSLWGRGFGSFILKSSIPYKELETRVSALVSA